MHISAENFHAAFIAEWQAALDSGEIHHGTLYESRRNWTSFMLGDGGFLNRVMQRVEQPGMPLLYKTEWYSVDALYVGGENLFRENHMYPSSVEVLIEHEWDENIEEEMWKLIHWRAPLKVIITYDWSEEEKTSEARKMWACSKIEKLLEMLKTVNQSFNENPATEYLFLMACRKKCDGPIFWQPTVKSL